MKPIALLCVLSLSSCGIYDTYKKLESSVDKLDLKVSEIDKVADTAIKGAALLGDKAQPVMDAANDLKAAVHAADKDGSGSIQGIGEIIALLTGLYGVYKSHSVQKQADDLYDKHNENKVAIAAKGGS